MSKYGKYWRNGVNIAKELGRRVGNYHHELLLADPSYHDDVYFVSFPKSGSTWMHYLMGNVALLLSGLDKAVTFYNCRDYVPDVHYTR